MAEQPRYRVENGEPTIDVKATSADRVFDNRDPAPYRERDLDPAVVEYLIDSAEDLRAHDKFRIVFWLETPCQPNEIEQAFRAHFEYELARVDRTRRRHWRTGIVALGFAVIAIIVLMSLAQFVGSVIKSSIGLGLKEGLVISSWVLMWKPVEVLVYDRIPWRRERKVIRRLLEMPLEVRTSGAR